MVESRWFLGGIANPIVPKGMEFDSPTIRHKLEGTVKATNWI